MNTQVITPAMSRVLEVMTDSYSSTTEIWQRLPGMSWSSVSKAISDLAYYKLIDRMHEPQKGKKNYFRLPRKEQS